MTSISNRTKFDFDHFLKENCKNIFIHDGEKVLTISKAVRQVRQRRRQAQKLFAESEHTVKVDEEKLEQQAQQSWKKDQPGVEVAANGNFRLFYLGKGIFIVDGEQADPTQYIDNEFLPMVIPSEMSHMVKVILFSRKYFSQDSNQSILKKNAAGQQLYEVKTRVAPAYLGIINLKRMGLEALNWGGRHNAGSTWRTGGTTLTGRQFGRVLAEKIDEPK